MTDGPRELSACTIRGGEMDGTTIEAEYNEGGKPVISVWHETEPDRKETKVLDMWSDNQLCEAMGWLFSTYAFDVMCDGWGEEACESVTDALKTALGVE